MIVILASGRYRELCRQLLDPSGAALGVVLGLLGFLVAMTALNGPRRGLEAWRLAIGSLPRASARRSVILLARSVYEEAFWRGALQILLGPAVIGVSVVAGTFTARHVYLEAVNNRPRGRARIGEFLLFSLLLGVTYALTNRLMIVIMIHWVRNLLLDALRAARSKSPEPR